jgi:hypothetical protein
MFSKYNSMSEHFWHHDELWILKLPKKITRDHKAVRTNIAFRNNNCDEISQNSDLGDLTLVCGFLFKTLLYRLLNSRAVSRCLWVNGSHYVLFVTIEHSNNCSIEIQTILSDDVISGKLSVIQDITMSIGLCLEFNHVTGIFVSRCMRLSKTGRTVTI